MNKTTINFKRASIFISTMVLVISCSQDKEDSMDDRPLSKAEVITVLAGDGMTSFADITLANLVLQGAAGSGTTNKAETTECYSYVAIENGFTVTFANCSLEGRDNINGSVEVKYASGEESASFTATFNELDVDGTIINGTRSYVFKGEMEEGTYIYTVTSDMQVSFQDGSFYSEKGTQNYSLVLADPWSNSTYDISGNWTVEWDGNTYNLSSSEGIQGNLSCENINKGNLEISKNGLEVTVNYGDGTCDDIATLIYPDGTTEDFTLD